MTPALNTGVGNSLTGATGIDSGLGRTQSKDNLAKAGEQFEAIFTGMMLKAARQARLSDTLFESKALDTFTEMQDAQVAKAMAAHTPLGIGKAMTDFLGKAAGGVAGGAAASPGAGANPQADVKDSAPESPA